jgi:putative glutamine amidotransferase
VDSPNPKPRIGIPTPTSIDLPYNHRSYSAYADAVTEAGGEPIQLDITADFHTLAASCAGYLLPGSPADVDPGSYNTPREEACGPPDPAREDCDYALLLHAGQQGKPVLGICYGCQSINVYYGGSLIQDLSPLPVNHEAGAKVAIAHTVLIPEQSLLGSILLGDPEASAEATPPPGSNTPAGFLRLPVNTSHHQSVALAAPTLAIAAHCPDDEVIEALEFTPTFHVEPPKSGIPPFLLAVQWHPERSIAISAASRALFARLIHEAN